MRRIIPIIMGSKESDFEFVKEIGKELNKFKELYKVDLPFEYRAGSAHKTPEHVAEMVREYDASHDQVIYETVAGRENALSSFICGQTPNPVIACPPFNGLIEMLVDGPSSYRNPSGIYPMFVPGQKQAAIAAISILGLSDPDLRKALDDYKRLARKKVLDADRDIREGLFGDLR